MGSRPPVSASSSASLLLPASLPPSVDDWFVHSPSDLLLTQALTGELHSTSTSSSSSSGPNVEASNASALSKHSNDFFHCQTRSNVSQVGSPLSSDSVCKDHPGSPFNHANSNSVFGMANIAAMSNQDLINENCITQQYKISQGGSKKPETLPQAPSILLSSQASAGTRMSKVSKKRSRASKKVPITVLSADTSNFREMVQQLTGIPAPPGLPNMWTSASGVPLLKPQHTNFSPFELPTLDTSSSFLASKINPLLHAEVLAGLMASQRSKLSLDRLIYNPSMMMNHDLLSNSDGIFANSHPKQPSPADTGAVGPTPSSIESFLMGDEDEHPKVPFSTVDSWLSFDGGALSNLSPKLDLAKIAS